MWSDRGLPTYSKVSIKYSGEKGRTKINERDKV